MGQGTGWNDVAIYRYNHFRVDTSPQYESLFRMLELQRFDFFARGVEEAPKELSAREELYPNIRLEETLCLHYPFVRYFWTSSSPKGVRLKERLLKGLNRLHKSGRFDELFYQYKGEAIETAHMNNRRILRIVNPFLPKSALATEWLWYKPDTPKP